MRSVPMQDGDARQIERATYDPDDNKIRLYSGRVSGELYAHLKGQGWNRAYKQGCFFAVWSPLREDTVLAILEASNCPVEIVDEDTNLFERAEMREARFVLIRKNAQESSAAAARASDAAVGDIPFGQPIMVGTKGGDAHRRAVERAQDQATKAYKEADRAAYWARRAEGVRRHAAHKHNPVTIHNRIKKLGAEIRKHQKEQAEAGKVIDLWQAPDLTPERAMKIANHFDHLHVKFPLSEYPRDHHTYEGSTSLYSALVGGIIGPEQARDISVPVHERLVVHSIRWIDHLEGLLTYWRLVLDEKGGTQADQATNGGDDLKPGMWVKRGRWGWGQIKRVNKGRDGSVNSVSLDPDSYSERWMPRKVSFTDCRVVMSDEDYKAGKHLDVDKTEAKTESAAPLRTVQQTEVDRLREQAQALQDREIVVNHDPDFYPTPPAVLDVMIDHADLEDKITFFLEPSAGDGRIANEIRDIGQQRNMDYQVDVCEIDFNARKVLAAQGHEIVCDDFITYNPPLRYDRIIMNPPFSRNQSFAHLLHAWSLLAEGGRVVCIMPASVKWAERPVAAQQIQALIEKHGYTMDLPDESFKDAGTLVKTCLVVLDK